VDYVLSPFQKGWSLSLKLLVAYDGSECADAAIDDMRRAGLPEKGKALVLCTADARLATRASHRIQSYFPEWEVVLKSLPASSADVILRTSMWWRPDLLIAGQNGERKPAQSGVVGNIPLELVHQAPCSVRVARGARVSKGGPIRLIVGNDGSAGAQGAIQSVARRTWPENTEVRVLSIGTSAEGCALKASRNEVSGTPLRSAGLKVDEIFLVGDPRLDLVREARLWNSDAIFVGARGLSAIDRFLVGSVSTAVVTRARCAVEVVR
jgi:nucleotide-binding universal stress UspA family protein